ncbi:glycyl-tRNA synthetase beta chain [Blastomonas natatoria]|uniref:Glycine--tRNA ligase beta subunit n=1 Tax=Blastomonas natatoria TaxID=34015 RepID=A0A2V3VCE2_9SPHN|nr:glycine--tRNA ligase subunit beta [Blastomonas natatoria]PXW79443.1 glycyl-tRNA synthetase beta chain [Blastomonas natatoria]
MTDFLLELLSEEIPARMQAKARADLEKLFADQLAAAGLKAESLQTWSTPRRLALIARGLPETTQAVSEELKGPPADAPDAAVEGFLRKAGLTRDALETRDVKGRATLFAVIDKPGRATADVLSEAIPAIVRAFPWPKSMRWGAASQTTESLRWVRPLQGIIALLGGYVVPCEVDGLVAGNTTVGHRFHHQGAVTVSGVEDYADVLRAAYVIVDHEERAKIIRDGAAKAAADAGFALIEDEGLVVENAGLTEWPVPLLGRFDPAFLEVPPEVIQLTARVNQKYFVVQDARGALAPAFVCTANIAAHDGGQAIVAGNEKVLAARLSDARFFWELDQKKTLEQHAEKLKAIVFHEKLGTVADKVERVAKLARWLCEEGIIKPSPLQGRGGSREAAEGEGQSPTSAQSPLPTLPSEGERAELANLAEQAARLCKADLVTEMVGEFPELQGLMGGYYAVKEGLDTQVAAAIRDHYKPVGQGDDVPNAPVTVAVSLADKLDTIAGFFFEEMPPTGSRDPFALRRAALGVWTTISANGLRLHLQTALTLAIAFYGKRIGAAGADLVKAYRAAKEAAGLEFTDADLAEARAAFISNNLSDEAKSAMIVGRVRPAVTAILDFFADRLKVQQREAGVRHDLIDAVFALGGEDDLVRLLARVKALQGFVETGEGTNLLAGYKRAANILKKEEAPSPLQGRGRSREAAEGEGQSPTSAQAPLPTLPPEGERALQHEPAEIALIDALDKAEAAADDAIAAEDFEGAMAALAELRAPIDAFFESVTVNDADPAKREARLNLLARFRAAVHRVADFSKIEG